MVISMTPMVKDKKTLVVRASIDIIKLLSPDAGNCVFKTDIRYIYADKR